MQTPIRAVFQKVDDSIRSRTRSLAASLKGVRSDSSLAIRNTASRAKKSLSFDRHETAEGHAHPQRCNHCGELKDPQKDFPKGRYRCKDCDGEDRRRRHFIKEAEKKYPIRVRDDAEAVRAAQTKRGELVTAGMKSYFDRRDKKRVG